MLQLQGGTNAGLGESGYRYERRSPKHTQLYAPVEGDYPGVFGPAVRTRHGISWVYPARRLNPPADYRLQTPWPRRQKDRHCRGRRKYRMLFSSKKRTTPPSKL